MRIAKFDRYDIVNNPGDDKPSFTIWFAGCSIKCPNCHNTELQSSEAGENYNVKTILYAIDSECSKLDVDTVVLLGGEPLEQPHDELIKLISRLYHDRYKVWLYTGHEFEDVPDDIKQYLYTIKCGPYVNELRCEGFPASSNQRVFRKIDGEWKQIWIGGNE